MPKKNKTKEKDTPYNRGRKWGFAVASTAAKSGKGAVMKADKAMQTCARNARTGTKRLSPSEREAYRGAFDGMYDAIKRAERRGK